MKDKYDRTNILPTTSGTDYLEKDLILSNWDLFEIKRPIQYNSIKRQDIGRPDLLSLRIYGTMSYFWILAKVNAIDDFWNDMVIGRDIIIPDVYDIKDWVLKMRSRLRRK